MKLSSRLFVTASPPRASLAADEDGVVPTINVPQVLLNILIAPLAGLWLVTLPFGVVFAILGHPILGVGSVVANMLADALAQSFYRRWLPDAADGEPEALERRIAVVVALRALVAIVWPVAAVLVRGNPTDLMFFGVTAAMLISVGVAQGSLSPRLYWMSAGPILVGMAVVSVAAFPLQAAAGLLVAIGLLAALLSFMSGGVARMLGEWSEMRERNNRLIERLRAEREEAETAREEARRELVELQARLFALAAVLVRPGGALVYAVCSLLPEEGRDQVDAFLVRHPDFVPDKLMFIAGREEGAGRLLSPAHDRTDGFFVARLRRAC